MPAFVGGNLEQLATLTTTFAREGDQVQRLTRSIDANLGQTQWTGLVADEFRRRWNEEFQPVLMNLHDALLEASRVVAVRRDAIDQATNLHGA
ncbi:MAG TPA: hypothetical protein VLT15_07665 [Acidimicrobiia bacterium]|nr:hypothetical protein [Acidimicrobiia bacterium]